jgi:hypothetical protein
MSNHNAAEKAAHLKSEVSLAMVISQGLDGPNPAGANRREMDSRLIFLLLNVFPEK